MLFIVECQTSFYNRFNIQSSQLPSVEMLPWEYELLSRFCSVFLEHKSPLIRLFHEIDQNNDGIITLDDFRTALHSLAAISSTSISSSLPPTPASSMPPPPPVFPGDRQRRRSSKGGNGTERRASGSVPGRKSNIMTPHSRSSTPTPSAGRPYPSSYATPTEKDRFTDSYKLGLAGLRSKPSVNAGKASAGSGAPAYGVVPFTPGGSNAIPKFTDDEIATLFRLIDADHSEGISYQEFLSSFFVVHDSAVL